MRRNMCRFVCNNNNSSAFYRPLRLCSCLTQQQQQQAVPSRREVVHMTQTAAAEKRTSVAFLTALDDKTTFSRPSSNNHNDVVADSSINSTSTLAPAASEACSGSNSRGGVESLSRDSRRGRDVKSAEVDLVEYQPLPGYVKLSHVTEKVCFWCLGMLAVRNTSVFFRGAFDRSAWGSAVCSTIGNHSSLVTIGTRVRLTRQERCNADPFLTRTKTRCDDCPTKLRMPCALCFTAVCFGENAHRPNKKMRLVMTWATKTRAPPLCEAL